MQTVLSLLVLDDLTVFHYKFIRMVTQVSRDEMLEGRCKSLPNCTRADDFKQSFAIA